MDDEEDWLASRAKAVDDEKDWLASRSKDADDWWTTEPQLAPSAAPRAGVPGWASRPAPDAAAGPPESERRAVSAPGRAAAKAGESRAAQLRKSGRLGQPRPRLG